MTSEVKKLSFFVLRVFSSAANIINKRRRRVLDFWQMIFGNHLQQSQK